MPPGKNNVKNNLKTKNFNVGAGKNAATILLDILSIKFDIISSF